MTHELLDLIELMEPEDPDTCAILRKVEFDPDEYRLCIDLEVIHNFEKNRWWRTLECKNVYCWVITEKAGVRAAVVNDHPALLPFTDNWAELTFRGTPADAGSLANSMRAAHAEAVGSFIDFDEVFNSPLKNVLTGGFGKIAQGPITLLERFKHIADEAGLSTSLLDHGPPKRWIGKGEHGGRWVEIDSPPTLFDFGHSYVISERFVVTETA